MTKASPNVTEPDHPVGLRNEHLWTMAQADTRWRRNDEVTKECD